MHILRIQNLRVGIHFAHMPDLDVCQPRAWRAGIKMEAMLVGRRQFKAPFHGFSLAFYILPPFYSKAWRIWP